MRRPLIFTLTAVTALGIAGTAVAHGFDTGRKTSAVAATFNAAPVAGSNVRSCTGADGTYTITRGDWSGPATSADGRLSGPLLIRGELAVNQTTGLGWLVARVKVDGNADGRNDLNGDLRAVIANGKLTGFVNGRLHDQGVIYGSVGATVGTTGFTDGQIGGGTVNAAAVVIDQGRCATAMTPRPVQEAKGTVTAVSAASLAVRKANGDTLTCVVGSDLTATVAKLKVGDTANVTCGYVDGSYRLLHVQSSVLNTKPVASERGSVTAVSATSLTVKGDGGSSLTCVVGSDFAAAAAKLAVGDRVAVTCATVDGSYRVVKLATGVPAQRSVITVQGAVSAVSTASLTVSTEKGLQTCAIGTDLAATVASVSVGQKVKATCGLVDGSYRLLSLRIAR